jgi:hypothetical protein
MRFQEKLTEMSQARNEKVATHAIIDVDSEGNIVKIVTSIEDIDIGSSSEVAESVRIWWEKLQYKATQEPQLVAPILLAAISRGKPFSLLVDLAELPQYAV